MRGPLLALALSLSLYGTATAGPVISTLAGDATVATGITGLEIPGAPGVVYDVDFSSGAGESFNAIFGLGDPPSGMVPTFWDNQPGAEAMRDEIVLAINAGAPPGVARFGNIGVQSNVFFVPYNGSFVEPGAVAFQFHGLIGSGGGWFNSAQRDTGNNNYAWAVFSTQSAVVPEPSSVTLALMGALGLLGYGWRRKRKRANSVS